jgi:hypothetical protein
MSRASGSALTRSFSAISGRVALALLVIAVGGAAAAQTADDGAAFVKSLVEAINSKSVAQRKALLHPTSLPCAAGEAAPLFDQILARQMREPVPANPRWSMRALPADQPLMFADTFDYPVRPTHVLQIDVEQGPTRGRTFLLQVVRDGAAWREVLPCPKPETLVEARAAAQARAKQDERVRDLAAKTAPGLRDTVVKLYEDGQRVDAFNHYARVSGEDLATAKAVVELLAGKPR